MGLEAPLRNLRLIGVEQSSDGLRPWLLVHSIRTIFLVLILTIASVLQVRSGNFLNIEVSLPIYFVLFTNFILNALYLLLFDRLKSHAYWTAALLALDALAITLLIYFTGTGHFLFLFLFLVNLILGGMVFEREGAWLLMIWTSICFSALLLLSPEVTGQNLYFSLGVNNLAFAAVTYLGGMLTQQIRTVGAQLRETQTDLRVLQDLNELIVSNITSGILVVSRTGFVQFFNQRATEILTADHFTQRKIQEVMPELNWPWESLLQDESRVFERREIQLQRSGPDFKIVEVVVARFVETDLRVKGWLVVLDDRTEQKALEDSLRQQDKLAAVGQLAAGIAHEIRNPLASISGSVQMMLSEPSKQTEDNVRLMQIVDKEISRLNGLITEFLEYVRPEPKPVEQVDLNPLVREVIEALQFNSKLRKDVSQKVTLRAAAPIYGNRDKLKQALLNLLINAYQAVEKTEQPQISVETFDQSAFVVLRIQDNGLGIKKENLSKIFEPFHTTKTHGTGLGLAITHKILQAHSARVSVQSVEGQGATFTVELPAERGVHTEDLIPLKRASKG